MTTCGGPSDVPLVFMEGETWTMDVTCMDAQGDVIDLTGAISADWRVASLTATNEIDALVLEAGIGSGITIDPAPTSGKLTIAIPRAMQSQAGVGAYWHELQIVTSDGGVSTQMNGKLSVRRSLFSEFVVRAAFFVSSSGASSVSAVGAAV